MSLLLALGVGSALLLWWIPRSGAPHPASPPASTRSVGPPRDEPATDRLRARVSIADASAPAEVLSISYRARWGEPRLISARVTVKQPQNSAPERSGVLLTISCDMDNGGERQTASIENVERGAVLTQEPRFIYTAPREGIVRCSLTALPFYGRTNGPHEDERLDALSGSSLTASAPLPPWTREWTWDHPARESYVSALLWPGRSWMANPAKEVRVPIGVGKVVIQVDHKVTVCTWKGGSSDVTTPLVARRDASGRRVEEREDLCVDPTPARAGAQVRSIVSVTRLTAQGRACAPTETVIDATGWVGALAHHARINNQAVFGLPTGPDCADILRIRSWVRNVPLTTGPSMSLVLHAPGERLAVLPSQDP